MLVLFFLSLVSGRNFDRASAFHTSCPPSLSSVASEYQALGIFFLARLRIANSHSPSPDWARRIFFPWIAALSCFDLLSSQPKMTAGIVASSLRTSRGSHMSAGSCASGPFFSLQPRDPLLLYPDSALDSECLLENYLCFTFDRMAAR